MKRIKHNDLTHYFLRDRADLPKAYLKKVDKFMWEIRNNLIRKQFEKEQADKRASEQARNQAERGSTSAECDPNHQKQEAE